MDSTDRLSLPIQDRFSLSVGKEFASKLKQEIPVPLSLALNVLRQLEESVVTESKGRGGKGVERAIKRFIGIQPYDLDCMIFLSVGYRSDNSGATPYFCTHYLRPADLKEVAQKIGQDRLPGDELEFDEFFSYLASSLATTGLDAHRQYFRRPPHPHETRWRNRSLRRLHRR